VSVEDNRALLFSRTWGDWEIYYNGYDTPADRCPTWAIWDNPIDDDGPQIYECGGGFRLNTPAPGILSIDRSVPDPLERDRGLGSVISRRDEYLKPADGLTLDFRVRVRPPTEPSGVVAYYRNADSTCYGLHLAQDAIRGGGYGRWEHQHPPKPFNTTDAFHTYRMVVHGAGPELSCYIDGKYAFDAKANIFRVTSLPEHDKYPTIIIGGEKGNKTTSYELDFVRYRRGVFAPGQEKGVPVLARTPHPMPLAPPRECCWNDAAVHCYPGHLERPVLPFVFQSARPAYNTYVASLDPPVTDKGDYTVEWDLTVDAECEPRGFSSYIRDGMGTLGILWSPDKVELAVGVKNVGYYKDIPIGIRRFNLDATQRHKYRIVRPANSFYAHLYIDGNPTPALYDQHLDASMGNFFDAGPPSLLWGDTLNNWGKGYVTIHDLRWSNSAFAPG
jgi:hypothetical protein